MPTAPKALEAFGDLQRSLAQGTMQAVAGAVRAPWKELYVDIRSIPDGTAHDIKFRVIPVSGAPISMPTSKPMEATVREIWNMRDACFSPPWCGMKLTISSQGQCQINFNYNPNCKEDPAFCND